jgi:hypothetical protein
MVTRKSLRGGINNSSPMVVPENKFKLPLNATASFQANRIAVNAASKAG